MQSSLPENLKKYFWGDDFSELNWHDHKKYIVKTLLEKGDKAEIAWLFKQIGKKELFTLIPKIKLSKKSENFWIFYLS